MKPQSHIVKNNKQDKILRLHQMKRNNKQTENNIEKTHSKMDNIEMNDVSELIQATVSTENLPKRKIKVDKKDKGLLERAESSRIVLTEDNKMLLGD